MAAREIALALGVPPLLLGLPGDNTFSNYQEANRTFWRLVSGRIRLRCRGAGRMRRQTLLPLVTRTAKALSGWLGGGLHLRPDLDQLDALAPDCETPSRHPHPGNAGVNLFVRFAAAHNSTAYQSQQQGSPQHARR